MKTKHLILVSMICSSIMSSASAQSFKGHYSGTIGIVNTKLRLQYEAPYKDGSSIGVNMNYYLVNWVGPVFEPFMRLYGKKHGNAEGFFGQGKLMVGNLSTLDYDLYYGALKNKRWVTIGLGLGLGYKHLIKEKYTIEPYFGVRYLTSPVYRYSTGYNQSLYSNIGEDVAWTLTTGFPIDFQFKFGYQIK